MDIEQAAASLEDVLSGQLWLDAVEARDGVIVVLLTAGDVTVTEWNGWPVRAERSLGVRTTRRGR